MIKELQVADLEFQQRKIELGLDKKTDINTIKKKIQDAVEGRVKDDTDLDERNSVYMHMRKDFKKKSATFGSKLTRYADFSTPGKLKIFKSKAAKTASKEYPLDWVQAYVENISDFWGTPTFKKTWMDPK